MATQEKHEIPVKAEKGVEKAPAHATGPFEGFERFFEDLVPRGWLPSLRWNRRMMDFPTLETRMPKLDVIDRESEVVVKAEVPGVSKQDISVSITGNLMTIKGETRKEEKEEDGDYYRCEISHGSFSRSVLLPAEVDDSKAQAQMRDGVLEVTLPKLEQAKKRDIKIA